MKVKLVCISLYPEDIETLEEKVQALKERGHTMNKSKLIRLAINQLKTERLHVTKSGGRDGV